MVDTHGGTLAKSRTGSNIRRSGTAWPDDATQGALTEPFSLVSFTYMHDGSLNYTGLNIGEKGTTGKKTQGARTRFADLWGHLARLDVYHMIGLKFSTT